MAKKIYVGVSGVARNVKQPYVGVSNVARKVKAGYIGVGGVARQFYQSDTPIGNLAVGTSVYMNVNGVRTEFLIVHQGNPSTSLYDSSCNGTWLLMKNVYEKRYWDATNNDYENSDIHNYLNSTFLNLFDGNVKNLMKQVKLPYQKGTGSGGSVSSGSSGLSTKIFLLSGYEVGCNHVQLMEDGACLSYFSGTSATDSKRIGYYNGTAVMWSLRSPQLNYTALVFRIGTSGELGSGKPDYGWGVRPAMIFPSDTPVDDSKNIIAA